ERDQIEHQLELLVERIELADRRFGQLDAGEIALLRALDAPLDLADRVEVLIEDHAVAGPEAALELARPLGDEIEQAAGLPRDGFALLRRVAFAEKAREHFARIELHRQRGRGVAERQRG